MNKINSLIIGSFAIVLGLVALYVFTTTNSELKNEVENIGELPMLSIVVTRTQSGYEPKEVTIKKGEVVLWKNESGEYHWPASDLHPTHAIYSDFDPLKPVASGEDWAFQFNQAGVWKYHDHIRANKVGTVTVVE